MRNAADALLFGYGRFSGTFLLVHKGISVHFVRVIARTSRFFHQLRRRGKICGGAENPKGPPDSADIPPHHLRRAIAGSRPTSRGARPGPLLGPELQHPQGERPRDQGTASGGPRANAPARQSVQRRAVHYSPLTSTFTPLRRTPTRLTLENAFVASIRWKSIIASRCVKPEKIPTCGASPASISTTRTSMHGSTTALSKS